MSVAVSTPTPTIPVIDDRLFYAADATKVHKAKVDGYNELLEDIFVRELELSKLKASLVDMRQEIVEEAQTFDTSGTVILPAAEAESEEVDEGADQVSDNSERVQDKKDKRRRSKGKFNKGKGREKSKIADTEMDVDWDYNLDFVGSAKRTRRASDASITDGVGHGFQGKVLAGKAVTSH